MQSTPLSEALVSLDAGWLCAAERDVEREEEERVRARAKLRRRQLPGKYERDSDAMLLDKELLDQKLEWRRKVAVRRHHQLQRESQFSDARSDSGHTRRATAHNNNDDHSPGKATRNVYLLENQRLAALLQDKKLPERVRK